MRRNKMDLVDDMSRFGRSLGNMTALIHSLSLVTTCVDIGEVELSRAIEAAWELSGFHEKEFEKLEEKLKQLQVKETPEESKEESD